MPGTNPDDDRLAEFSRFSHHERGMTHDVYATGDAASPPVLVMHELSGLTDATLGFAKRLRDAGFRVYLPHLFGTLLEEQGRDNYRRLCVSDEFSRLAAGVSAPVTTWLRSLAGRLSVEHGEARVGAIGMCLTGGFVIPLVLERSVVAPVSSQPAVPFSTAYAVLPIRKGKWARELNVEDAEMAKAATRLRDDDLTLLAFRFKADRICVSDKIDRLRIEFGDRLQAHEYDTSWWQAIRSPHAVLTYEFDRAKDAGPEHPTRQAFATLVSFLKEHLE